MSKSYKKKPFMAICGNNSAKRDKQLAHRGERRAHKYCIHQALKLQETEDYTPPIRRECSWNNVYSWSRDGKKRYQGLTHKHRAKYEAHIAGDPYDLYYCNRVAKYGWKWGRWCGDHETWPPKWYLEMMRK